MFGVGPQEMVIIGLLLLIVFGPDKLSGMARDFGRFVSKARHYKDEWEAELVSAAEDETPERGKVEQATVATDERPAGEEPERGASSTARRTGART